MRETKTSEQDWRNRTGGIGQGEHDRQTRTEKKECTARTNSEKSEATARTLSQDNQNSIDRQNSQIGTVNKGTKSIQPEQDSQYRTIRTGQPHEHSLERNTGSQDRTDRTGQDGQDRTGQPGQNMTARTEQDSQDRT
jgi:hypothetical protein